LCAQTTVNDLIPPPFSSAQYRQFVESLIFFRISAKIPNFACSKTKKPQNLTKPFIPDRPPSRQEKSLDFALPKLSNSTLSSLWLARIAILKKDFMGDDCEKSELQKYSLPL